MYVEWCADVRIYLFIFNGHLLYVFLLFGFQSVLLYNF